MSRNLSLEEKLDLVKQVGEEIITEDELISLLKQAENATERPIAYDGFEPSGQMHIAQGILKTIHVNKMIQSGFTFKMWVADWHAMANNKMGGDLEKIKIVGKYFVEVWRACGMDLSHMEFVWASDMVKNPEYWKLVLQVGKTNVLKRFIRTAEMMGREESLDTLTGANIIYSCMQVADIFMLNAHVAQLGMDQRKANMLAREVGPQLGYWKPVVVSHHMLQGLLPPAGEESTMQRATRLKMSKSNPDSAIFMTDTTADIQRKVNRAWCPEGVVEENPILEYCKYILFERFPEVVVDRPEQFGGPLRFKSYVELEKSFAAGELHPMDLKNTVARLLDELLQPVRMHFEENEEAKHLLEQVQSFQVTR